MLITDWDGLQELKQQNAVEGERLDFKKDISPDNEKIAKTICAFANTSGGLIVFGAEYNDNKDRRVKGFPGIKLTNSIESRIQQIAMSCRERWKCPRFERRWGHEVFKFHFLNY